MDLKIGLVYSFNTNAPSILGSRVEQVKLKSICDVEEARKIDAVDQKFAAIRPLLPMGSPTRPEECQYYVFEARNGSKLAFADIWIDSSTIEVIEYVTIVATVPRAKLSDLERIRIALSAVSDIQFTLKVQQ